MKRIIAIILLLLLTISLCLYAYTNKLKQEYLKLAYNLDANGELIIIDNDRHIIAIYDGSNGVKIGIIPTTITKEIPIWVKGATDESNY